MALSDHQSEAQNLTISCPACFTERLIFLWDNLMPFDDGTFLMWLDPIYEATQVQPEVSKVLALVKSGWESLKKTERKSHYRYHTGLPTASV